MNVIGQRVLLIISDLWDAYKKIMVVIILSFTFEEIPYFLVKNSRESSDLYLLSPRHVGDELIDVFNNNSVSVAIASLNDTYSSGEHVKVVKNSHYIGIGSIELCTIPS